MLNAEKIEILPLFPSQVWKSELTPEACASINRDIQSKLAELMGGEIRIRDGHSYQTAQDLHTCPEFAQLRRVIESALNGVLDFLGARHRPPNRS